MTHILRILVVVSILLAISSTLSAQEDCRVIVNFPESEPQDVEFIFSSECRPATEYGNIIVKQENEGVISEVFRFSSQAVIQPVAFVLERAEILITDAQNIELPTGTQVIKVGEDLYYALIESAGGFLLGQINFGENQTEEVVSQPAESQFQIGDRIRIINTQGTGIHLRRNISVRADGTFNRTASLSDGPVVVDGMEGTIVRKDGQPDYIVGELGGFPFIWHYVVFDNDDLEGWVPESYDRGFYFEKIEDDSGTETCGRATQDICPGDTVRVANSPSSEPLNCREETKTGEDNIVTRYTTGNLVLIIDGPFEGTNNEYTWYQTEDDCFSAWKGLNGEIWLAGND